MRPLLAVAALLTLPGLTVAQLPLTAPSGFGGGTRLGTPAMVSPATMFPQYRPIPGFGGGFVTPRYPGIGFPYSYIWGGSSYFPYYGPQYSTTTTVQLSTPTPVRPAEPTVVLANQFPAVLVLEFPAPAEVWVNGKKGEGEPTAEWTLTSPALNAGGNYTFEVKAQWKADGQTLGFERSYTVGAGKRSRAYVLNGTPVKK